eukprot:1198742-Prymnesium_polylepis.1
MKVSSSVVPSDTFAEEMKLPSLTPTGKISDTSTLVTARDMKSKSANAQPTEQNADDSNDG